MCYDTNLSSALGCGCRGDVTGITAKELSVHLPACAAVRAADKSSFPLQWGSTPTQQGRRDETLCPFFEMRHDKECRRDTSRHKGPTSGKLDENLGFKCS